MPKVRLLDCQQLWLLGASVGQPTVVIVGSKGCNLSLGSNLLAPPGALYKALPSLNWKTPTPTANNSLSFYLSSEAEASLRSELGSRVPKRLPARSGIPKRLPKKILQIRSERGLRKFNRFFYRIVVWIWDFWRRIFFNLPSSSTVGVPPK